eukprot:12328901-Alexandrium_andersonii.AAC.1
MGRRRHRPLDPIRGVSLGKQLSRGKSHALRPLEGRRRRVLVGRRGSQILLSDPVDRIVGQEVPGKPRVQPVDELSRGVPVSYTHLTLPTICSV